MRVCLHAPFFQLLRRPYNVMCVDVHYQRFQPSRISIVSRYNTILKADTKHFKDVLPNPTHSPNAYSELIMPNDYLANLFIGLILTMPVNILLVVYLA